MTEAEERTLQAAYLLAIEQKAVETTLKKHPDEHSEARQRRDRTLNFLRARASIMADRPQQEWSVQPDPEFIHRS